MTVQSVRAELIQHIRGHNKVLSVEYLSDSKDWELLAEAHPNYRDYFAKRLADAGREDKKAADAKKEEEKALLLELQEQEEYDEL